ncbi:hypothetical protein AB431_00565 [Mycobacterium sp. EPa45]|nr:hypothetical protein AB431_00565 [Mycobacterium sp. EPa45]
MVRSLLIVESWPASEDVTADYDRWSIETHIPEMLRITGFQSARRGQSDTGSVVTVYEIGVAVDIAKANLRKAVEAGLISPPVALQTEPPPEMRYVTLDGE